MPFAAFALVAIPRIIHPRFHDLEDGADSLLQCSALLGAFNLARHDFRMASGSCQRFRVTGASTHDPHLAGDFTDTVVVVETGRGGVGDERRDVVGLVVIGDIDGNGYWFGFHLE